MYRLIVLNHEYIFAVNVIIELITPYFFFFLPITEVCRRIEMQEKCRSIEGEQMNLLIDNWIPVRPRNGGKSKS